MSLLLVCAMGITSFATADIDKEIDQQEEEIKRTEEEISETEKKQEKLEQAKAEMEAYLADLNKQYSSISAQVADLEQQITDKAAEILQTQADLEAAQATADQQYEDMKVRIQYMYENPQASFWELLLVEGSFAEALTRAVNIANLVEYDDQKMEEYITTREMIADKEIQLQGEKEALDELYTQITGKQKEVEELADSAKSQINKHMDEISQAQAELDGKENTLANQKAVLEELIAEKKRIEAELEAEKMEEIQGSLGSDVTGQRKTELEYVQYEAYNATEEEITALAVLIYCEAANQGDEGRLAVGAVVMNRIRDSRFKQYDIMSVIRSPGQFSPVTSGRFDLILSQSLGSVPEACYVAARRAIAGECNVGNRTFFRTYRNYPNLSGLVIGDHIFSYTWNYSSL